MKTYKFQDLADSNRSLMPQLEEASRRVIESGRYLHGPETEAFESEIAQHIGTDYAVSTSNGLSAIRLMFRALIETGQLRPGDGVLVPANTFIASILPLTELGLLVQPVDPDYGTMTVTASRMAECATPATRAALLVHLYGYPAWDAEGAEALRSKGILLLEDNAQAIGAAVGTPEGLRPTGSLGIASAISFYPGKNIGALGDAGAVNTDDKKIAQLVEELANYGGSRRYYYDYLGYNNRIDEIQAAFLRVKLPHIGEERSRREAAAKEYLAAIRNPHVTLPPVPTNGLHGWHQFVVRTPRRDELQKYLADNGVQTLIHYPVPPHRQKCYQGLIEGEFPVADRLADEVLSLPIANITPADAREIAEIINRFN